MLDHILRNRWKNYRSYNLYIRDKVYLWTIQGGIIFPMGNHYKQYLRILTEGCFDPVCYTDVVVILQVGKSKEMCIRAEKAL